MRKPRTGCPDRDRAVIVGVALTFRLVDPFPAFAVFAFQTRRALGAAGLARTTIASPAGPQVVFRGAAAPVMVLLHGAGDQARDVVARSCLGWSGTHALLVPDLAGHGDRHLRPWGRSRCRCCSTASRRDPGGRGRATGHGGRQLARCVAGDAGWRTGPPESGRAGRPSSTCGADQGAERAKPAARDPGRGPRADEPVCADPGTARESRTGCSTT